MQLPLRAGNDVKCGMRVYVAPPEGEIRLFIYEGCPFVGVNNFGGLQSHLDLNGLEFSTSAESNAPAPPLEPISISLQYADSEIDKITNLSPFRANNITVYLGKFGMKR